jgi:hypothetical protein
MTLSKVWSSSNYTTAVRRTLNMPFSCIIQVRYRALAVIATFPLYSANSRLRQAAGTCVDRHAVSCVMGRKLGVAFGLLLLLPAAARASIADVFQQLDHGTVDNKNFIKTLIAGIEDGFNTVK